MILDPVRRRLLGQSAQQFHGRYSRCLWRGSKCKNSAIRAHSIQNAVVLDALSEDGHVVMPRMQVSNDTPPKVRFERVGRREASTFTGLCGHHDELLFTPIEKRPLDIFDPEHAFLLAYRAVLKENHASLKAGIDLQSSYIRGGNAGFWSRNEPSAAGMMAVDKMIAAYCVDEVALEFWNIYSARRWKDVQHRTLTLNVGRTVAVNSMFSTDLESRVGSGAAFICLNVIPHKANTIALFSFLKCDAIAARTAFGHIWAASGRRREYLLSKLILARCENLVVSPALSIRFPRPK